MKGQTWLIHKCHILRYIPIIGIVSLAWISSYAQKYDRFWQLGGNNIVQYGFAMQFDESGLTIIDSIFRDIFFDNTSGSISDAEGNLAFYSNGCKVFSHNHQLMENGAGIGGGDEFYDTVCKEDGGISGMRWPQGVLILPMDENRYQMYHQNAMRDDVTGGPFVDVVYRSVIDMNENNGLGSVIEKNEIVLNEDIIYGNFVAVRHANGEDWWSIFHHTNSDTFQIAKVSNAGVEELTIQAIGEPTMMENETGGQAKFTSDGKKYVHYDLITGLQIFDFHRGTGVLSNPVHIPLWRPVSPGFKIGGMAISANSRYLYACGTTHLDQFDLWAADIAASRILIDTFDGYAMPFPTQFFLMQLAPDDKIYMSTTNGTNFMHVINQPNMRGDSCDFAQRGLELPSINYLTMPYFPNFSLGADSTLVSVQNMASFPRQTLRLSPNPVLDELHLDSPYHNSSHVSIYDMQGRLIQKNFELKAGYIDVKSLLPGVYILQLTSSDGYQASALFTKI